MNDPLISVIIPIYRVEAYLKRCVDSVLAQTYPRLQVILVDDGSADNCPNICDKYAAMDGRIEVIHQANAGVSNARNKGLKMAKGEYILFIDSDDYIAPDMCEKLLALIKQEQADMAVCNITYTYPHKSDFTPSPVFKTPGTRISSEQALVLAITEHSFGDTGIWNKLFARELLTDFSFKEGVRSEDFWALCDLFPKASKIVYTPQSFYYYFQNPAGVTASRNLRARIDSYQAVKHFIEVCRRQDYQAALKAVEYRYLDAAVVAAFLILLCDKKENYKDVFNEIVELGKMSKEKIKRSKLSYSKKWFFKLVLLCPGLTKAILCFPIIHWGLTKLWRAEA